MTDEQLDSDADEHKELSPSTLGSGEEAAEDEGGAGKRALGLDRWIQLGFVVAALIAMWLYSHLISTVWYAFADPNESLVTAAAVILGVGTSMGLYRNQAVYQLSAEVADELSKVTWPTRPETSSSTIVVIVASIIAACVLGFFDAIWSTLTDLVYKV